MEQEENKDQNIEINTSEETTENHEIQSQETNEAKSPETDALKAEVSELKDKYLRLYSEFDNFRRRTSKEKIDFFKTANKDLMQSLLPVLDDFERAHKALTETEANNNVSVTEGINLIYNKLFKTLEVKGLKIMETKTGSDFNSEFQEAITQSPAPTQELKGKVIDVLEKGYSLNDKVIRFAKVIIGS